MNGLLKKLRIRRLHVGYIHVSAWLGQKPHAALRRKQFLEFGSVANSGMKASGTELLQAPCQHDEAENGAQLYKSSICAWRCSSPTILYIGS